MKQIICNFLDEHESYYPEFKPERIRNKITYGYHCDTDQIICHLGLIPIKDSAYNQFYRILSKNFNLNKKHILEVGCGLIPILSRIIKSNTNCQVTAINSKILFKDYYDVTTIEYDLTSHYDLSNFDIVIGFRPCLVTENVIDLCFQYKKDFLMYLCPCDMKPIHNTTHEISTAQDWRDYIIDKVKQNKNYYIEVFSSNDLQDDLPIIMARYKN